MKKVQVTIIEADAVRRKVLTEILSEKDVITEGVGDVDECMAHISDKPPCIVIAAGGMDFADYKQLYSHLAEKHPRIRRYALLPTTNEVFAKLACTDLVHQFVGSYETSLIQALVHDEVETILAKRREKLLARLVAVKNERLEKQNVSLEEMNQQLETLVERRTIDLTRALHTAKYGYKRLKTTFDQAMVVFSDLLQKREGLSFEREKMGDYAVALGKRFDMNEKELNDIYFAALLHNVGKVVLPDDYITQPYNRLTYNQKQRYHKYPRLSETAVAFIEELKGASDIIRHHKEYVSGRGFPDRLGRKKIPWGSRVLCVVVEYMELISGQLISRKFNRREAIAYLKRRSGVKYEELIVEEFIKIIKSDETVVEVQYGEKVKSDKLKSGMVLAQDLCSPEGLLLMQRGREITDSFINKLRLIEAESGKKMMIFINVA